MDSELPLQTQLALQTFKNKLQNASREQAIELAIDAFALYLHQKHMASVLLKGFNPLAEALDD
jgi:hypothetical protein